MDRHLNLFYSYNHDNELIENNLTRAWIVTLKLLSQSVRNRLLHILFDKPCLSLTTNEISDISFEQAQFALQGNMNPEISKNAKQKFVITIASNLLDSDEVEDSGEGAVSKVQLYRSIPDGWIYEPGEYCFLVEAKIGENPLDSSQLLSHSIWLGLEDKNKQEYMLSITWVNVIEAIEALERPFNDQESLILTDFVQFLRHYGYRTFKGFSFNTLKDCPSYSVKSPRYSQMASPQFDFSNLNTPPEFRFKGANS